MATPSRQSAKSRSTLIMLAATALLLPLLFPPFYCLFLAPIALVPFALCILRRPFSRKYIAAYYLLGLAFFLPNLFWLGPVTVIGLILLCLYLALYFPLFAFAFHRLTNQFRLPATFALPLAWVAVEYLRCTFVQGGFPWFMLGNSLAPLPLLTQTADLTGVWGLTFFICLLNGCIVDLLRLPIRRDGRFNPIIGRLLATATILIAFVLTYGQYRLAQQTITPGPRVAVIQENIPQSLKEDPNAKDPNFQKHVALTKMAAAQDPPPALIAWPETMVPEPINPAVRELDESSLAESSRTLIATIRRYDKTLRDLSTASNASLLVGAPGYTPGATPEEDASQNLALLYTPGAGQSDISYAKRHLVPFGEYIPFRSLPLVGKYMIHISPNGFDYSLIPGKQWTRFPLTVTEEQHVSVREPRASVAPGGSTGLPRPSTEQALPSTQPQESILHTTHFYTFAVPICFEDTMPEPARMMTAPQFAHGRKTDFLVNISNDGWFYSAELNQRLQASQLRAVENRVPIARSVNTGNSGFIDSCGRILKLVTDSSGNSIGAVGTAAITLPLDSRISLYSQIGDLLPITSGILTTLITGWTILRPRRQKL